MSAYFIRRLMLVPITFFAITFMVYAILRVVPGGPIEQAETAMKMAAMRGEGEEDLPAAWFPRAIFNSMQRVWRNWRRITRWTALSS